MVFPLLVTLCKFEVSQILTSPVLVLTAVSVPAIIWLTPYCPSVAAVTTVEPFENISPPTYSAPPIPAPPATTKAPVVVETAVSVPTNCISPVLNTPYVPVKVEPGFSTPRLYHSRYPVSLARPKKLFVPVVP